MKKILSILIISALVLGTFLPSFAEETVAKEVVVNEPVVMNYLDALNLAKENSQDIKIIDEKIAIAKRRLHKAEAKAKTEEDRQYITDVDNFNQQMNIQLVPLQKQWEIDKLNNEKEVALKNIKLNVTDKYISLDQKAQSIENKKLSITTLEADYDTVVQKVKLGLDTETNKLAAANAVLNAKYGLAKLEREHSQLIMDLNRELGLDLTTNLVMGKKALLGSAFPEYDLDKLIKDLNENSFDVLSKQKNLEFNELELHITKREYIQTPKGSVDTMEDNIVVYKDELEKQKISSEVKVRNDYLNLQNLEDSLRIAELSLQLSEKNYSTTKVRYELGLVTSLDFVKAGDDVRAKKEAIESAKLDLYKAVVNFEHDNKL